MAPARLRFVFSMFSPPTVLTSLRQPDDRPRGGRRRFSTIRTRQGRGFPARAKSAPSRRQRQRPEWGPEVTVRSPAARFTTQSQPSGKHAMTRSSMSLVRTTIGHPFRTCRGARFAIAFPCSPAKWAGERVGEQGVGSGGFPGAADRDPARRIGHIGEDAVSIPSA